jgi:uncharacterized metal-binding protein
MSQNVVIVPCSGIGKTYGTVSREAAYEVVEDLRPDETQLVALSMLVLGDESAREAVANSPAITIDGCKLACASKMVQESGGTVAQEFAVLDVFRRNRKLKPQGIAELNEGGLLLARALAEEVTAVVDELQKGRLEIRDWRLDQSPISNLQSLSGKNIMPNLPQKKVGIVACSGEEMAEGTVTRLAALKVLEELRPDDTVTICLPLFLAGGEGDRAFARFYPTIAMDGCELRCAARATEQFSGKPAASVVVSEIVGERGLGQVAGRRRLNEAGQQAVAQTAVTIADLVDTLLDKKWSRRQGTFLEETPAPANPAGCACGSGIPVGSCPGRWQKGDADRPAAPVRAVPANGENGYGGNGRCPARANQNLQHRPSRGRSRLCGRPGRGIC